MKHRSYDESRSGRYMQGNRDRVPKDYKRSDKKIKEDICDALMQAPHLNCSEIKVSVKNGSRLHRVRGGCG